ncbi:MAG: hypothetical protein ACREH8_19555 [Opitutaceae bacterium]
MIGRPVAPVETQEEFLFADGPAPEMHQPDPRSGFYAEITALWEIPLGENVHIALGGHSFDELHGRLHLARAPDLPLNRRDSLALRIGTIEFSSRHIVAWALA